MKILAIDTATEVCSVAILDDKNVIIEKTLEAVNTHSVALMPLIKEVLEKANMTLDNIDLFACDNGPGSFTGIRIGLSTIKAFCDVTHKPCVGVSSLEGFAYKLSNTSAQDYYICSLLNANHGNAYCGIFCFDNGKLVQIHDYFSDSIENILEFVNNLEKNIFFVGNCSTLLKDMIQSNRIENELKIKVQSQGLPLQIDFHKYISATDIGLAAFDRFCSGSYGDSDFLTPLYLKKSSAENNIKK